VTLPVIDLRASLCCRDAVGADPTALQATAAEVAAACSEHGFFYVSGHGMPQAVLDETFALAHRFFALPEADKARWHIDQSPIKRGFDPIGWQVLDPGMPTDLKESFYLGVDRGPDDALVRAGVPQQGPNQWPDEARVPGFRAITTAYEQAARALSHHIMALIAIGLGLPADHFEAFMQDPMPVLRLLHYPTQPAVVDPGQIGCGAHTDWGGITLLAQDDAGGLQVQGADGRWFAAPPLPGTLVVNLGDLMQRWTNHRYRSTLHRVLNPTGTNGMAAERYSIAYFFDIDYHAVVTVLPACVDAEHPALYPPITAGEHVAQMYTRTTAVPPASFTAPA
jgi:isopenicillin N synthase-like dioxygenase